MSPRGRTGHKGTLVLLLAANGHSEEGLLLLEGSPGLQKTLALRTPDIGLSTIITHRRI
ncbi:hypothetical protein J6590_020426 [Homalodisca vitripennis]|nr:hypothetical protein J6590_020426 [Homalodisca vitripennis]